MKLLTTLTLILFTLSIKAQVISCPPSLNFKKDTSQVNYALQTSGFTNWTKIISTNPNGNAKEGYVYDLWIPLKTNVNPISDFLTTFIATQYRSNQSSGDIEMQACYCVYVITKK